VAAGRVDLRERRIPTPFVHATAGVIAVALAVAAAVAGEWDRFASALMFAAAVTAVFALAQQIMPERLGMGDVRLAFVVTLTAGWHGLDVVLALWWWTSLAALVAALVARRRGEKYIPTAPAMAVGWSVALVLGT
jgi:leader peptidase (prepilin peptidase)/N-methyltransferase